MALGGVLRKRDLDALSRETSERLGTSDEQRGHLTVVYVVLWDLYDALAPPVGLCVLERSMERSEASPHALPLASPQRSALLQDTYTYL